MDVVLTVRHPAGFAGSVKRLRWTHDFGGFLEDGLPPELERFEPEIREQARRPGGVVEQAALLWRILYAAVDGYRRRHPDWVVVRHEDLSRDPLGRFEGAVRAARARVDAARAGRGRAVELAGQPAGGALEARRARRERRERRTLARPPDPARARARPRADATTSGRSSTRPRTGSRSGRARRRRAASSAATSCPRQRPSVSGAADLLGRDPLGVSVEPEEGEDRFGRRDGLGRQVLEADAQVALAEPLAVLGRAEVDLAPERDRALGLRLAARRAEHSVAVLAELHLVAGEGHVPAVADDVQEAQAGQLVVEHAAGGRSSAAPSSPTGARPRPRAGAATSARSSATSLGRPLAALEPVDPAVGEGSRSRARPPSG